MVQRQSVSPERVVKGAIFPSEGWQENRRAGPPMISSPMRTWLCRLWGVRAQFQQLAVGPQPPVSSFCQIFWTRVATLRQPVSSSAGNRTSKRINHLNKNVGAAAAKANVMKMPALRAFRVRPCPPLSLPRAASAAGAFSARSARYPLPNWEHLMDAYSLLSSPRPCFFSSASPPCS